MVAASRAFCESDAAVPKPRQTTWIYLELRRPQCHHDFFIIFFMAIGESLKLKKLEQLFLSSLCDCVNDCFLVRVNWTKC